MRLLGEVECALHNSYVVLRFGLLALKYLNNHRVLRELDELQTWTTRKLRDESCIIGLHIEVFSL